ncbi:hypothetical protein PR048_025910 [Dryococelus australis]|uniref:Uncharacterized protein n=1 Tax=Dryococelus australis TaxID=614101 RepID=A0ABQ9GJV0_9NEOP|nr:hypothetical protein PR048_025910 [Dryococelus australis]
MNVVIAQKTRIMGAGSGACDARRVNDLLSCLVAGSGVWKGGFFVSPPHRSLGGGEVCMHTTFVLLQCLGVMYACCSGLQSLAETVEFTEETYHVARAYLSSSATYRENVFGMFLLNAFYNCQHLKCVSSMNNRVVDEGKQVDACFIDFDKVPHGTLMRKVEVLIPDRRVVVEWIGNFLRGRRQRVKVGEAISVGGYVRVRFTRKKMISRDMYRWEGQEIEEAAEYKYLEIVLQGDLRRKKQVERVVAKGRRAVGMLGRVLNGISCDVKEKAYGTMVRPMLEYAAAVWDPYVEVEVRELEKVQRKAVRWVKGRWRRQRQDGEEEGNYRPSVMMKEMGWSSSKDRRKVEQGRGNNSEKLQRVWRTERGRQSMLVRSVREWNVLREELVSLRGVGLTCGAYLCYRKEVKVMVTLQEWNDLLELQEKFVENGDDKAAFLFCLMRINNTFVASASTRSVKYTIVACVYVLVNGCVVFGQPGARRQQLKRTSFASHRQSPRHRRDSSARSHTQSSSQESEPEARASDSDYSPTKSNKKKKKKKGKRGRPRKVVKELE